MFKLRYVFVLIDMEDVLVFLYNYFDIISSILIFMVGFLIQGGLIDIEYVVDLLRKKVFVFVVKGSGLVVDFVVFVFNEKLIQ